MKKWIARGLLILAAATLGAYFGKKSEAAPPVPVCAASAECHGGR
ncbi:hypothetical protein Afil01_17860 [Actinorhabdospora filicis]|uniref:Uncharacterized protein n=1 Tax=Actinorhabdospora filicis TaxID=1785913 RepID=A0A9W6SH04_9ACTN|nr:hypothetical protein [Actinorhabdospora filicis]GLZ76979.1 hypothetical protein Afil01_17860 [Actinorhabdospora filicis]